VHHEGVDARGTAEILERPAHESRRDALCLLAGAAMSSNGF